MLLQHRHCVTFTCKYIHVSPSEVPSVNHSKNSIISTSHASASHLMKNSPQKPQLPNILLVFSHNPRFRVPTISNFSTISTQARHHTATGPPPTRSGSPSDEPTKLSPNLPFSRTPQSSPFKLLFFTASNAFLEPMRCLCAKELLAC